MANLVNDVEYYVIVMGNTTAGVSFCQDPDFPVLGSVCTTVTPTAPQGVFAPMPLYAVILVALVVVLLPLTFLLANYRYEVACLAAESCPESRPEQPSVLQLLTNRCCCYLIRVAGGSTPA